MILWTLFCLSLSFSCFLTILTCLLPLLHNLVGQRACRMIYSVEKWQNHEFHLLAWLYQIISEALVDLALFKKKICFVSWHCTSNYINAEKLSFWYLFVFDIFYMCPIDILTLSKSIFLVATEISNFVLYVSSVELWKSVEGKFSLLWTDIVNLFSRYHAHMLFERLARLNPVEHVQICDGLFR